MTAWRVVTALNTLLAEINAAYPDRDKSADGGIGDTAHAARTSDHNPEPDPLNPAGPEVVRARDYDSDGIPAPAIALALVDLGLTGDPRLGPGAYVIWDRRIAAADSGWAWHPYSGADPHTGHIHLSICRDPHHYDSDAPWGVCETPEDDLTPAQSAQLDEVLKRLQTMPADVWSSPITYGAAVPKPQPAYALLATAFAASLTTAQGTDPAALAQRLKDELGDQVAADVAQHLSDLLASK